MIARYARIEGARFYIWKKPDVVFISITCYFAIYRLLQVMETQEYGFRSEYQIYTVVARIESLLIVLFGAREEPFEYF